MSLDAACRAMAIGLALGDALVALTRKLPSQLQTSQTAGCHSQTVGCKIHICLIRIHIIFWCLLVFVLLLIFKGFGLVVLFVLFAIVLGGFILRDLGQVGGFGEGRTRIALALVFRI